MFEVVCINGNYHVNGVDGNSRFISTDKNSLIKELAARIGVSILTSDEVAEKDMEYLKEYHNVCQKAKKQAVTHVDQTDWDTEPISQDGIQFNKHFIGLKLRLDSLETELKGVKHQEDYENITCRITNLCNEITSINSRLSEIERVDTFRRVKDFLGKIVEKQEKQLNDKDFNGKGGYFMCGVTEEELVELINLTKQKHKENI